MKRNNTSLRCTFHCTSIPPHSSTLNIPLSAAREASTPTTSAQYLDPSPAVSATRALAASHNPRSPSATPRKSINTRVTTSGAGAMRSDAARSYASCAMKRSATYSCFRRSGSQYLCKRSLLAFWCFSPKTKLEG
jgi:hypothetical protein